LSLRECQHIVNAALKAKARTFEVKGKTIGLEAEAKAQPPGLQAWTFEAKAKAWTFEAKTKAWTLKAKGKAWTFKAKGKALSPEAEAIKIWLRDASRPRTASIQGCEFRLDRQTLMGP